MLKRSPEPAMGNYGMSQKLPSFLLPTVQVEGPDFVWSTK